MSKNGASTSAPKPALCVTTAAPTKPSSDALASMMATPPHTPTELGNIGWSSLGEILEDHLAAARRVAISSKPPAPPGVYIEENGRQLGKGAWAEVERGTLCEGAARTVVAIKKPCYPGADAILEEEARILSYISGTGISDSVVRFFGFDSARSTIVMEHIDGPTLAQYTRRRKAERGIPIGTTARSEPVIGLPEWLDFSKQLTETFTHLKSARVVHGDISWHNVLVKIKKTETGVQSIPVVIDFSSGHLVVEGYRPPAVSATTTGFCSPELLEAHIHRPSTPPLSPSDKSSAGKYENHPIPTYASDLYGLAMTLLCAASGSEVYQSAGRHAGIYARQGQPLEYVRNGDACLIAGVRSVVTKVLNGCFGRDAERRICVEELRARVVDQMA